MTTTILFYAYAGVAVAGAVGLVAARRLLHGVMSLFATLVAIGGLYLLMGMEFLAAMQLFVYGGAITVLVMFALMLAGPRAETADEPRRAQRWVAGIVAVLFALAVGLIVATAEWEVVPAHIHDTASIATILFSRYALPFEIAGLSLTIALIGAVVIARQDDLGEQTTSAPDSARPAEAEANVE